MQLTEVFRKFKVLCTLKKEISCSNPTIWINENNLHQMKLRLVEGAWVRIDGPRVRRLKVGGSSSFEPSIATNETLELL